MTAFIPSQSQKGSLINLICKITARIVYASCIPSFIPWFLDPLCVYFVSFVSLIYVTVLLLPGSPTTLAVSLYTHEFHGEKYYRGCTGMLSNARTRTTHICILQLGVWVCAKSLQHHVGHS